MTKTDLIVGCATTESCKCGWRGNRDDLMTWEIHEGEEGYSLIRSDNCVFKCPNCFEVKV